MKTLARLSWPGLALAAALLLPFLATAYTIDDTLFLLQAKHLLLDPLHPTAFEVVWTDVPARLSAIMPSGPVMAWLLVPAVRSGGAEWMAHAVELAALAVAIVATVSLALRLGLDEAAARRAGLILAATPAVLGMAGTAMPDVPAMAFGVLFLERFVAWWKSRGLASLAFSALAFALAMLTRSHALLLGGVALVLASDDRAWWTWRGLVRPPLRAFVPLALALGLAALALAITGDPRAGSSGVVGAARDLTRLRFLPSNLVAFAAHWALALPLTLPWALLRKQPLPRVAAIAITIVAAAIILITASTRTVWVAPIVAISVLALVDLVRDALARRDHRQFALALWVLAPLPVAIYIHLPPKYLLVAAPAAALIVAPRLTRRGLAIVAGASALVGVLLLSANARFAGFGREAVRTLVAPRVQAGAPVWFAAHWGFQYYALEAGARPLTRTPPLPAPGDFIVSGTTTEGWQLLDAFPRRRLVATLADAAPGGRILSWRDGAGFFSNGWGYLPWSFGCGELERFNLWQVE